MDETVDTRDEDEQGDASPVAEIVDWVARDIIEGRLQPGDDLNSVARRHARGGAEPFDRC
jgi:DNA-binding GntR family transcriptional regulator